MTLSPPATPDEVRRPRPQSMYSTPSPENMQKHRPHSALYRPARSSSRKSVNSKHGLDSRTSDDDGKTSVKVAVRVRPSPQSSDPGYDLIPRRFQRSMVQVNTSSSLAVDSPHGRKLFIFDRVFGEDVSQRGVWDYLQDSVDSFLQGYNVSILAYGQSGAGKSYTMGTSGSAEQNNPSTKGVIPRAATRLFDCLNNANPTHSRQNSGLRTPTRFSVGNMNSLYQNAVPNPSRSNIDKTWELSVTYVEIYNEQPRDLLLPESVPLSDRANVLIREDAKGRIYVEGLKSVPINTVDELLSVLNVGSAIRQTDATTVNPKSSRSHAVFTINLRQSKPQSSFSSLRDKRGSMPFETVTTGESLITVESKLHFVDLAGSERMKNTGAIGDRAREGISINAGLASLGKVISQLSSRSSATHVSYRDSKLTRMLQDSLGGNAITYMIACVTPAEFYLSETLNTVQYAQRARNIQSKPKIQQIPDDADKQAIIDRLKTEVAFLRLQIRSAEPGERRNGLHAERSERPSDREVELQHHLLDVQENYTTLSQRHAKLISELTAANQTNAEPVTWSQGSGESAVDRLKRSQARQEEIEQVVLEYEKTIQSLETNLSTTRSTLANTESSLLERETKCAYVETLNQHLSSRVQKLMDREANTETYLQELEARLESHSSGEHEHDAIISELRKEIARVRESETNAEDYITTLEERLAEADQDMELLQRELERLDHLVERQRSLGKLDNLLYELDHIQQKASKSATGSRVPTPARVNGLPQDKDSALETLREAEETELPADIDGELVHEPSAPIQGAKSDDSNSGLQALESAGLSRMPLSSRLNITEDDAQPSPAQSRFVADKFESVTQELFDLRLEHESTVSELDLLTAKYQEAQRTLAEMQEIVDGGRQTTSEQTGSTTAFSRPSSFLAEVRGGEHGPGRHVLSSRSLSSELSLAGESRYSTSLSDITPVSKKVDSSEVATQEIERLQQLLAEHERGMNLVTQQYTQLQTEHKETLSTVETLKSELYRNKNNGSRSPGLSPSGMLRRTTWQTGTGVDRGLRSITSLRTIMAEEFDDRPDRWESVEVHLNAANNELQSRMEKIQSLEAETKSIKKEMELKSTIISGLTRERTSLTVSSPVDLSIVAQIRDQLVQKETELKSLHEAYANREQELQNELHSVTAEKMKHEAFAAAHKDKATESQRNLNDLKEQFKALKVKSQVVKPNGEDSQQQLANATSELEAALASVDASNDQHVNAQGEALFGGTATASAKNYHDLIVDLKRQNEELRAANSEHANKITEFVQQHATAREAVDEHTKVMKSQKTKIDDHLSAIAELKDTVTHAESTVEFHKHGLKTLHESHAKEIANLKVSHAGAVSEMDRQLASLSQRHNDLVKSHNVDLERSKRALQDVVEDVQAILGHPTSSSLLVDHVRDLMEKKKQVEEKHSHLIDTNAKLERQLSDLRPYEEHELQLASAKEAISKYQTTIQNLATEVATHEETLREQEKAISKHQTTINNLSAEAQKKDVMIEELEQQLQNSFDQHNKRISDIQLQSNLALVEAQQRIAALEKDLDNRKSMAESDRSIVARSQHRPHSPPKDVQPRTNSMTSHLRKSVSLASLPSPPPAIPLPPIPSMAAGLASPGLPGASSHSPPRSRHVSNEVPPHAGGPLSPGILTPPASASYSQPPASITNLGIANNQVRHSAILEEQELRLRTIEKHLNAEKQLNSSLEEALADLETQSNKLRVDMEAWKKKAWSAEEELTNVRKERRVERLSVQQVAQDERNKRREAEVAREQLEERMRALNLNENGGKKRRKGGGLNCF